MSVKVILLSVWESMKLLHSSNLKHVWIPVCVKMQHVIKKQEEFSDAKWKNSEG